MSVNKTSNPPDLMNSEILEAATWQQIVSELKTLLSKDVFDTWFKELVPLAETNDKLILEAANEFAAYWIQDNYLGLIRQVIEKITGRSILISVKVAEEEKSTVPRNRLGADELSQVDLYDPRLSQSETPSVIRGNHPAKPQPMRDWPCDFRYRHTNNRTHNALESVDRARYLKIHAYGLGTHRHLSQTPQQRSCPHA